MSWWPIVKPGAFVEIVGNGAAGRLGRGEDAADADVAGQQVVATLKATVKWQAAKVIVLVSDRSPVDPMCMNRFRWPPCNTPVDL